ncbi:MAG: energy transducer TonB [Bacteroidia bacterium]
MLKNLLILISIVAAVQEGSAQTIFYDSAGRLFADTSLSIDSTQRELWNLSFEFDLMNHFSLNFNYPLIALENNIKGAFILKLTIDSSGKLVNCEPLKNPGWLQADSAISALKLFPGFIQVAPKSSLPFIYYLPIKLQIINQDINQIEKENKLIIRRELFRYLYLERH